MKIRSEKENDQELARKTYMLLREFLVKTQQDNGIESALWMGPMICTLSEVFENSGVPYEQFKEEMITCVEYYKY